MLFTYPRYTPAEGKCQSVETALAPCTWPHPMYSQLHGCPHCCTCRTVSGVTNQRSARCCLSSLCPRSHPGAHSCSCLVGYGNVPGSMGFTRRVSWPHRSNSCSTRGCPETICACYCRCHSGAASWERPASAGQQRPPCCCRGPVYRSFCHQSLCGLVQALTKRPSSSYP
jgi:hypothetical protein